MLTNYPMKTPTLDRTINGLYIGYKDINPPHQWYPLALLTWDESEYHFQITQIGFQILEKYPGFWMSFPECKNGSIYRGKYLPMVIQKRMPWGREDDKREIEFFFDSNCKQLDGIASLARNGGLRSGDPFDICPLVKPAVDSNIYQLYFSPKIIKDSSELVKTISIGTTLSYCQESNHSIAILNKGSKIAYLHGYFSHLSFSNLSLKVKRNDDEPYLAWRLSIEAELISNNLYRNGCFRL
jgi:hypothetical protein